METSIGIGFTIIYYLIIIDSVLLLIVMLKYSIKKHQFQAVGKTMWVNVVFIAAAVVLTEIMIMLLVGEIP